MKKILAIIILLFPALVISGSPIIVDQETEKFLETLGNNANNQRVINNLFDQKKNQYLLDSANKRNNPIAQYGEQYLKDSMNNQTNLVRRYVTIDKNDTVSNPFYNMGRPVRMRTLYSW